ncbi:MAG: MFS transporter [Acidiferrobacterales bacterium]
MPTSSSQGRHISLFGPLREPLYRALWIATIASNIGTWMQDVGASWLMTTIAPSPAMIALVRTASSLPIFLLALPAGALADVLDRRLLLLATQFWMLAAAATLGALTITGLTTPGILLAMTFALGLGSALNAPAWQAIIPELVPQSEVTNAVSLNSAGMNLARAIGPAIGGLLIAVAGPGLTFLFNAISFGGVIVVLYHWRRAPETGVLPAERVMGAIRAGLRYVRHTPPVRTVLARFAAFILFGSALWSLLPAVARFEFGRGPGGYGIMLAAFGMGAVSTATLLPWLRQRVNIDTLLAAATLVFAAGLVMLAWVRLYVLADLAVFACGAAWISLISTFNSGIQALAPSWVRGRAVAVSILVFFGGMSIGSAFWGYIASLWSIPAALTAAGACTCLGLLATRNLRLHGIEKIDLAPSLHWPMPQPVNEPQPNHGPVVVTVEYRVDVSRKAEFLAAMQPVRRIRRRDGAISWAVLSDVADPGRYTEVFVVESWLEHMRQHTRVTKSDRHILDHARSFHIGASPPVVTHFLVEPPPGSGNSPP